MDVRVIVFRMEGRRIPNGNMYASMTFYEDMARNRVILTFKSLEQVKELIEKLSLYIEEEEVPSYGEETKESASADD